MYCALLPPPVPDMSTLPAVLPPEACGILSRPVVYALFSRATTHLSVVHAAGPTLARAVRTVTARPRRTRLPELLSTRVGAGTGTEM